MSFVCYCDKCKQITAKECVIYISTIKYVFCEECISKFLSLLNNFMVAPQGIAEAAEQQPTNAKSSASLQPMAH